MKIKVLFFMFSLQEGGAQRTVVNIINNLDKNKFEILLVLGTTKNNVYLDYIDTSLIKVIYLNKSRLRYCILKLARIISLHKPDLLFSTLFENNIALLISRLLSLKKIPVIVREATHRTQFGIASRINRIITQIAYNSAQSVVALSHGVGEDLISNFGVKKEKITVIYNPVDIAQIKYLSNEQINDLNFQDDEVLIIAVGRLEKEKDYPTLLKAFCIVRSRFKARLIILGSGLLERELKDMAHKLNLNGHINFLGFKKNPYKYFRKADIFVLSSKCEGFGHVIVEAMATGTPVISTDCESGPREIIGENECGVLVPVGDHKALAKEICSLIRDKEKSRKLALRGLERAEAFEAKTIVPKYEFLFMDVLNKSMQVAQ